MENITLTEKFRNLNTLGFETPDYGTTTPGAIPDLFHEIKANRDSMDYDIDGIVFSVDNVETMINMGLDSKGSKHKGQIALKFPAVGFTSTIIDIEWSFEGGQAVSPVAIIEPVEIMGATIQRAGLKSYQYIVENNVGIGTVIELIRSGDVIPKVESIISTELGLVNNIPETCPHCSEKVVVDGAVLKCENDDCVAKTAARINHFLKTYKIKGLAWASLLEYAKQGVDLYHFVSKDLQGIEVLIDNSEISMKIWEKIKNQLA